MRQRLYTVPGKNVCAYRIKDTDWKPDERYAYDNESSLDIVAKVDSES